VLISFHDNTPASAIGAYWGQSSTRRLLSVASSRIVYGTGGSGDCGSVIGGLYHHSMIPIFERTRLRPLGQLFQSLSKLFPGRFASIPTTFTVWAVDSQEGQQVADPTLSSVTLDFK
jgi:hypothetical protein